MFVFSIIFWMFTADACIFICCLTMMSYTHVQIYRLYAHILNLPRLHTYVRCWSFTHVEEYKHACLINYACIYIFFPVFDILR